jgi:hypothetical protein
VLSTAGTPKRVSHHHPEKRAEKKQRPKKLCEGDAYKEKDSRTGEERIIPAHFTLPLRVPNAYRDQRPLTTVGSTGDRNTLTFLRRWSVGDEAAAADLLLGGPAG